MRAFALHPFPNLSRVFHHPILDVNFLVLIARPRQVEAGKEAVLLHLFEFFPVKIIAGRFLRSKKQPVLSFRPDGLSFLQISAERCYSGSGPDHDDRRVPIFREAKLRGVWEHRDRHVLGAFREKSGTNAAAFPPVTCVMHHVDREVDLVRMRFQTRRDRIQTRLQFREDFDEFLRRNFDRRMLGQEVDHLHAPEVTVEVFLPFRIEQLGDQRRRARPFGDHFQKFRRRLGDAAIAEERFAQGRLALRSLHFLFAGRADCLEDFVDELRIVRRPDRHRIADFVIEAPASQIDSEMTRVFFRAFAAQTAVDR